MHLIAKVGQYVASMRAESSCKAYLNLWQACCYGVKMVGLPQIVLTEYACACSKRILHKSPYHEHPLLEANASALS